MKPFIFYTEPIEYKAEETSEGKKYFVEGYISTKDIDLVNDIVTEKALNKMLSQLNDRNIKVDFEHEAFRGDDDLEQEINKSKMPLGRIVSQTKDDRGIKVVAQLNPSWKQLDKDKKVVRDFKDIWKAIKDKFLDAFSIAYVPLKTTMKTMGEGIKARLLDDINLLNVALTGNPVNPNASLTSVMAKSLEYIKDIETKPFGPYEDFDDCVRDQIKKGHSEESAKKICATIHKKITGKYPSEKAGDNKMEEKKEVKSEEKQETSKPDETKQVEQEKPEQKSEPKDNDKPDFEKMFLEVKSEIDELKKQNAELKAIVEKARYKAIGVENKAKINEKSKENIVSKSPLDLI